MPNFFAAIPVDYWNFIFPKSILFCWNIFHDKIRPYKHVGLGTFDQWHKLLIRYKVCGN